MAAPPHHGRRHSSSTLLFLTVLGLQLGAGLSRHQAGHEAVVVLGADAALGGHGGGDGHGGADVGPREDRARGGGGSRGGGGGGGGGLARGGQVLFLGVEVDGVEADLSRAAGLSLVLDRCRGRGAEFFIRRRVLRRDL